MEAEVAAVNAALLAALEKDVKATMSAMLEQMGTDASLRAKAVAFIESSLLPRAAMLLNDSEETQNLIADNLKKVGARVGWRRGRGRGRGRGSLLHTYLSITSPTQPLTEHQNTKEKKVENTPAPLEHLSWFHSGMGPALACR